MSSDPNTPHGPDPETIRNLNAMMPSFIKGMEKRKIIGKGNPGMVLRPRKVCKVCGLLWDRKFVSAKDQEEIKSVNCGQCEQKLKDGMIAMVYGDKYAFVTSKGKLDDWKGKVIRVSAHVMDQIDAHFADSVSKILKPEEQTITDEQKENQPQQNPPAPSPSNN